MPLYRLEPDPSTSWMQQHLAEYGYFTTDESNLKEAIAMFQLHFQQENVTGVADSTTANKARFITRTLYDQGNTGRAYVERSKIDKTIFADILSCTRCSKRSL